MKNIIIAIATAGFMTLPAAAEITLSGDAKMGVDYNSGNTDYMSKHSFVHEVNVNFMASGATDGGLSFGTAIDLDGDGAVAYIGSDFGTLSIGDVDPADEIAGSIADIGLFDIGVNDKVHGMMGGTASQLRYDATFGSVSIAVSAGVSEAVEGMPEVRTATHVIPGLEEVKAPVHTIPGQAEVRSPTIIVEGRKPNTWFVSKGDTDVTSYSIDPTLPIDSYTLTSHYDQDLNIQRVSEDINAENDDEDPMLKLTGIMIINQGNDPVNILGYSKKVKEEGDPEFYMPAVDGQDAMKVDDEMSEKIADAFEKYEEAYDLGEDMTVDGNDMAKLVSNDGIEEQTIEGKVLVAAIEDQVIGGETLVEATADITVGGDLITAAVPQVASENQYAFGASFDAGAFTIGAGYDSTKTISLGGGATFGDFSTNALFSKDADDNKGIGLDVGYTMNASTVTLAFSTMKPESGDAMKSYGLGLGHDLGGGAHLNAGFGKVDDSNKASVGLSFAF